MFLHRQLRRRIQVDYCRYSVFFRSEEKKFYKFYLCRIVKYISCSRFNMNRCSINNQSDEEMEEQDEYEEPNDIPSSNICCIQVQKLFLFGS